MPCKLGTREAIEAGKRWHKEQREQELYDPFRKLWRTLVNRAYDVDVGFERFSDSEKQYFAVNLLDGEIYNGGFDQYFFNDSGSYYEFAQLGLDTMGATESREILQHAKERVFGVGIFPVETINRRKILLRWNSLDRTVTLNDLDKAYCNDPDGMVVRIEEFAIVNKLVDSVT